MSNKKKLAELRKEKHYTQRDLAKMLGLGSSTIAMYEVGKRIPSLSIAIKIANIFEIPVENIIFKSN